MTIPNETESAGLPDTDVEPILQQLREAIDYPSVLDRTGGDELSSEDQQLVSSLELLLSRKPAGTGAGGSKLPEQIDRFIVRGFLGTGAFGIVFRAYDPKLDREVALKILRPEAAFSAALRERFVREVQTAANLDHPGILTAYEAGTSGMVCFLASPLCEGPTLARWLAQKGRQPSPPDAAELIARLADAVQHAHFRGVLHRDLKPSNVLLQPIPDDGGSFPFVPKLTDFGLAKRVGEATVSSTGMVLGTAAYMSPEQAQGRWKDVGVASDIFALGIMLYEVLTGVRPFVGPDEAAVRERIVHAEPVRPTQVEASIPRGLEFICLRCLAKDPAERYVTAAALAEDLRNFTNHRPLVARPGNMVERAWLACRRRPLVATLLLAIVLIVAGSVWALSSSYYRERVARQEAERKLDFARQAVHAMYTRVAERWLAVQPEAQDLRREFLEDALRFYREIAKERPNDERSRHELSVALHREANILKTLGRTEEAIAARRECLALVEQLIADYPHTPQYQFDRFINLMILSGELVRVGNDRGSLECLVRAEERIRLLVKNSPAERTYADALAAVCNDLALQHHNLSAPSKALPLWREAAAISTVLMRAHPDQPQFGKHAAVAHSALARRYGEQGDTTRATEHIAAGLQFVQDIRRQIPDAPWCDELEYSVKVNSADVYLTTGFPEAALPLLTDCWTALNRLVTLYPKTPIYRQQRGQTCLDLGKVYVARADRAQAVRALHQAAEDWSYLAKAEPENELAVKQLQQVQTLQQQIGE